MRFMSRCPAVGYKRAKIINLFPSLPCAAGGKNGAPVRERRCSKLRPSLSVDGLPLLLQSCCRQSFHYPDGLRPSLQGGIRRVLRLQGFRWQVPIKTRFRCPQGRRSTQLPTRSEERRVGKEGSSRWSS